MHHKILLGSYGSFIQASSGLFKSVPTGWVTFPHPGCPSITTRIIIFWWASFLGVPKLKRRLIFHEKIVSWRKVFASRPIGFSIIPCQKHNYIVRWTSHSEKICKRQIGSCPQGLECTSKQIVETTTGPKQQPEFVFTSLGRQTEQFSWKYMGVSKNNGTPKSSILIGFSIIHHPFWGTTIFGNIHIVLGIESQ